MAIHFLAQGQDLLPAEPQKAQFSQGSSRHGADSQKWVLWARLQETSVQAGSVGGMQEQHLSPPAAG